MSTKLSFAVTVSTGILKPASRKQRINSNPSRLGIIISEMIRSIWCASRISMASWPSPAIRG
ncbi:hypothetical protein D3C81_2311790 [compost metagenome]